MPASSAIRSSRSLTRDVASLTTTYLLRPERFFFLRGGGGGAACLSRSRGGAATAVWPSRSPVAVAFARANRPPIPPDSAAPSRSGGCADGPPPAPVLPPP